MNRLILASGSPRRREILKNFNLDFDVRVSNIEEKMNPGENAKQIAMALALEKALDIAAQVEKDDIIIAADTVVVKDEILGKPQNQEDAFRMLKMLQGDIHYVITGMAIVKAGSWDKVVAYQETKVKLKTLKDEKIDKYIKTGEALDKAGSYGIQGKGTILVEWIEGDYFNVVGLPISKLDELLSQHFNISLL